MQHLNLYWQLERTVEPPFSSRQMMWAIAACVSVMVVIYGALLVSKTLQQRELTTLQQQQKTIASQLSALAKRKAKLERDDTLEREISRLQNDIKFRRQLLNSVDPGSAALHSSFADHLTSLARQHIDGMWFTEIQLLDGGQKLALLGRTRAPEYVPQYLQKLAGEDIFDGHRFRVLRMSIPAEQKQLLDFELRANDIGLP